MSDHIAHLAICDDVFRLAALHPQVHATFKRLIGSHHEIAHLGSITRFADKWSADLIDWSRGEYARPADDRDPNTDHKVAFVLGALTHRSADRHMKPITRCWGDGDDSGFGDANESKIYQDVFAFKEVYDHGQSPDAPFGPEVLLHPTAEVHQKAEDYFRVLLRRALIAMHTIKPDPDHIHDWLDAFFDGLQTYPKRLSQYAQIAAEWDPIKVQKYLIEKKFYDRNEPLIRLCRGIQRGSRTAPEQVVETIAGVTDQQSRWSRALKRAIEYLIAGSDLLDGRIDLTTAKDRFDIGVPELSLRE
jgi:hypothetical protein